MQMQRMKFGRRIGAPDKENKKEWVPCEKPPKKILVVPRDRSNMLRNLTNVRKTLISERSTPADGAKKDEKSEEKKSEDPNKKKPSKPAVEVSSEETENEDNEFPELD